MTLYDKIIAIYPELNPSDFGLHGTILLSDEGDGEIYIYRWNHPTLAKPTEDQLK